MLLALRVSPVQRCVDGQGAGDELPSVDGSRLLTTSKRAGVNSDPCSSDNLE